MRRVLLCVVLLLSAACSGGGGDDDVAVTEEAPPFTYVAVGASESVGVGSDEPLRQAWPQVFYRRALPRSATFVNLGISGATVRDALAREVPGALAEEPRLVTVWLNVNDLVRLVPAAAYERDLTSLVARLRRGGRTEVLLANTPPLEELPVVRACLPDPPPGPGCIAPIQLPGPDVVVQAVAQYNDAIARVAKETDAVLVDLHAAAMEARRNGKAGSYVAADGFHPSVAGHEAVARVFEEALRSSPRTKALAAPA